MATRSCCATSVSCTRSLKSVFRCSWPRPTPPAIPNDRRRVTSWRRAFQPIVSAVRLGQEGGNEHACQRSEEHTSELQSLMRISYAVFCLKKKKTQKQRDDKRSKTVSNKT